MKIVPKFQNGGGFNNLFTLYTPSLALTPRQVSLGSTSKKTKEDPDKGKLTLKDLFNMIKEIDGLPNEMNVIVNNLMNTFKLSSMTGVNVDDLATTYLLNLYLVKIAIQNKKKYDDAIKTALENGSMAEPAISMDGKLIAQDKEGKINTVTLLQYHRSKDQYNVLSVSLLANLRAYKTSLNNNLEIFNVINNSMGFESFLKLLKEGLTSLGNSEKYGNLLYTLLGLAIKGLLVLQNMNPEERVAALSGTIEGTTVTKDQVEQMKYLTKYLTTLLPDRAKTWAAYKLGMDNKNEATARLIGMLLASTMNDSISVKMDYEGFYNKNKELVDRADKKAAAAAKAEANSKEKMTFLTGVQNGYGGLTEERTLNLGGQASFHVTGTAYGAIADLKGTPIADATLSDVLTKSGLSGISNTNSIWFGDQLISSALFNKVAIANGGGFRAILPCIKMGTLIRPDFELINSFEPLVLEVNKELGNNATFELRQSLLERKIAAKPELRGLLTATGKLDESKFLPFFIVLGLASDLNFEFKDPKNSKFLSETKNNAETEYFKTVTKSDDYDADDSFFGDMFGLYDKVYKSDVFIPISTHNRLAAIIFSGLKIPDSRAMQIEQESLVWDKNLKVTSSSNLLGI